MQDLTPIFATSLLVVVLTACVPFGTKPVLTTDPEAVIEIRHSEALTEQINTQQKLMLVLKLNSLLDAEGMANLRERLSTQLAPFGTQAVVLDLGHGEQIDLRRAALEQGSSYVITLFAGDEIVLEGHGALASGEMIANLFDASSGTALWASLLRVGDEDAQAPSSAIGNALAVTLVDELARIGVLSAASTAARIGPAPDKTDVSEMEGASVLGLKLRQTGGSATPWAVTLNMVERGDEVVVLLAGSSELAVTHMILGRPERLVMDLAGVELVPGSDSVNARDLADHPLVARVRVAQYQPSVVRIVLDLRRSVNISVLPRITTATGTVIDSISLQLQ